MTSLGDYRIATEMRDVIAKLVRDEIARQRPAYSYAVVETIDRVRMRATVKFGDEPTPVPVKMGSIQPSRAGQVVRIDGLKGDRFIVDVMGDPYFNNGMGAVTEMLFVLSGGTNNKWPFNLVSEWLAYFGAYDLSSGATDAWKETTVYLHEGTYQFYGMIYRGSSAGRTRLWVDGVATNAIADGYHDVGDPHIVNLGVVTFDEPGVKTIRVGSAGTKNAASDGYYVALSGIQVVPYL